MSKWQKQQKAEKEGFPRKLEEIQPEIQRLMQAIGGNIYSVSQFGSGALTFSGLIYELLRQLDELDREAGRRASIDKSVADKTHIAAAPPYEARQMTDEEVASFLESDEPAASVEACAGLPGSTTSTGAI